MDRKTDSSDRVDPLGTQLLFIRLVMLIIPVYLFLFSSSCGVFGPSISQNDYLSRAAFVAMFPGIGFAVIGVLSRSNYALCLSGATAALIMIVNRGAELYTTILDFVLLLVFLEASTTLASFSEMAKSIILGSDENVSSAYRVVLREYLKRVTVTALVTASICLVSLYAVANYTTQVGLPGVGLLTVVALLLVFVVVAARYNERGD